MPEALPVHVSRSELHAIETVESHEATGPFAVEVTNHGREAHVHLKLDDDLAAVAELPGDGNYFVEREETRRVRVDATPREEPVAGSLKVETGYGAESVRIAVAVVPPEDDGVVVDESLGEPSGAPPPGESGGGPISTLDPAENALPVAVLAVLALSIAGLVAVSVNSPVVVVGALVVLVAILAAAVILIR